MGERDDLTTDEDSSADMDAEQGLESVLTPAELQKMIADYYENSPISKIIADHFKNGGSNPSLMERDDLTTDEDSSADQDAEQGFESVLTPEELRKMIADYYENRPVSKKIADNFKKIADHFKN